MLWIAAFRGEPEAPCAEGPRGPIGRRGEWAAAEAPDPAVVVAARVVAATQVAVDLGVDSFHPGSLTSKRCFSGRGRDC